MAWETPPRGAALSNTPPDAAPGLEPGPLLGLRCCTDTAAARRNARRVATTSLLLFASPFRSRTPPRSLIRLPLRPGRSGLDPGRDRRHVGCADARVCGATLGHDESAALVLHELQQRAVRRVARRDQVVGAALPHGGVLQRGVERREIRVGER